MNPVISLAEGRVQPKAVQGGPTGVSLFSGAGGMDVGFRQAGFDILWANDLDKVAVETYRRNLGGHVVWGDIEDHLPSLSRFAGVDCLFGGPPCQGFSVAGKMAADDPRSQLVRSFMRAVEIVRPRAFVMENVKALGTLAKFKPVRDVLRASAQRLGYQTELHILNAKDFGVPQARERVFFVGFLDAESIQLEHRLRKHHRPPITTLEALKKIGPQGSAANPKTCNAVVTIAARPVLRRSPYAGMMFNGLGRPLNPHAPCATLPASMGGNKTPIIDEKQFFGDGTSWVETYHAHLMAGGEPYAVPEAPSHIRRLTLEEARILHTFPEGYDFAGGRSATYRQIGNAVPCELALAVARATIETLDDVAIEDESDREPTLRFAFGS